MSSHGGGPRISAGFLFVASSEWARRPFTVNSVFTLYVAVTVLASIANAFSAGMDFVRHERVLLVMERGRVPRSWVIPLGVLKAAGAVGLPTGFLVPPVGVAAAVGLVLFFLGAVVVHLRARYYEFATLGVFLLLSAGALTASLAVLRR